MSREFNTIDDGYPAQIIRVKTESWVDLKKQLHFKKTVRQMRSLTKSDYYAFEDDVYDGGFDLMDLGSLDDGFYQLICHYEQDENGNVDGVTYDFIRIKETN